MPKEYTECVKSEIARGKNSKDAQRICAISFFKRHGKTPKQAEGSITFSNYELALFEILPLIDDALGDESSNKDKNRAKRR